MNNVYKKEVGTVANFPAYRVVKRDTQRMREHIANNTYTNIVAGDKLAFAKQTRNHGVLYVQCSANSCVSYALQYNDDPIAAYERAIKLGHDTHWITACAVCISDSPQDWETLVLIEDGMLIKFEGVFFAIKIHGEHVKLIKQK